MSFALTRSRRGLLAGLGLAAGCSLLAAGAPAAATSPAPAAPARIYTFRRGVNISCWLSQNYSRPYAAPWFQEADVAWIAAQGFDHVRIPVDGRLWRRPDGALDETAIAPFDRALRWSQAHGLGVILDMHFLPGASFAPGEEDNAVFTQPALLEQVADFWRRIAERYAGEGPWLRFELLNEPVADTAAQLNAFARRLLAAIRPSNPTRIVYLTSNRWSNFDTVPEVEVPDDRYVAFTFHFYTPMLFTHQRASWTRLPPNMPPVPFPGVVPDLTGFVSRDHFAWLPPGTELSAARQIDPAFARVAAWAREKAPGHEIHIGEFGAYIGGDPASRRRYIAAVRAAAEREGFSWAVWDYNDTFGVRDRGGKPTPVLEGLFPRP